MVNSILMKKVYFIIASFAVLLIMNSCAVHKNAIEMPLSEENDSFSNSTVDFVELKNGEIIYFNELKMIKGVFRAPHLIGDEIHKFVGSELNAYQIDGVYSISETQIENGHKSKVAIDALPGFAKRLVTGGLNVYSKKYYNGRAAVDEFYVQSGKNGKIYVYSPEVIKMLLESKSNESLELESSSLVVASDY